MAKKIREKIVNYICNSLQSHIILKDNKKDKHNKIYKIIINYVTPIPNVSNKAT